MRNRTEHLLSLRDGEPLDAAKRAKLLASDAAQLELRRLETVRAELRGLPELAAPPGVWSAIEPRLRAPARPRRRKRAAWFAAAAVVCVSLVGLQLVQREPAGPTQPRVAAVSRDEQPPGIAELQNLVLESGRLERILMAVPPRRGPIRADTAMTIAGLEDQIAWIDAALSAGAADGVDSNFRETLWRERVDMMSALVDVRMLQATAF